MLKAVALEILIWVEGEDEPAHNFVESSKSAVQDIINAGIDRHPGLKFNVKSIKEKTMSLENPDDSGDEF